MNLKVTKEEGLALRGLAIVLIVIHNVTRFFTDTEENEFGFVKEYLLSFLSEWDKAPVMYSFMFYGWVGVSIFVFMSGYGLTLKYENTQLRQPQWYWHHYLKLFFLLLPCFAVFLLIQTFMTDVPFTDERLVYAILEQSLILNIFNTHAIDPGVYWYFSMAAQLYLIFIFLRHLSLRNLSGLILAFILLAVVFPPYRMYYIRHNFAGWMPEFLLGIMMAKMRFKNVGAAHRVVLFLIGAVILVFSILTHFTFTFSGLGFVLMMLAIKDYAVRLPGILYLGMISGSLFVIHPVLRLLWFLTPAKYFITDPVVVALIVLGFSILCAVFYNRYYSWITSKLTRQRLQLQV